MSLIIRFSGEGGGTGGGGLNLAEEAGSESTILNVEKSYECKEKRNLIPSDDGPPAASPPP